MCIRFDDCCEEPPSKRTTNPKCPAGPVPWCNRRDCCGMFCALFAWGVIISTNYVCATFVLIPWFGATPLGAAILIAYESLFTLVCWSHYKAMCTNPGALPKNVVSESEFAEYNAKYMALPREMKSSMPRMCKKCLNYKGPGVHHCSICNRCTQDMDHHCPWVNNCVGKMNQKYFILFVFYVAAGEFVSILMLVARGVHCLGKPGTCADPLPPFGVLICIVVLVLSIFFLVFVIAMMCDQYEAIMEGNSIDRLKGIAKKQTCSEGFGRVFGEVPSWTWFLPIARGSIVARKLRTKINKKE